MPETMRPDRRGRSAIGRGRLLAGGVIVAGLVLALANGLQPIYLGKILDALADGRVAGREITLMGICLATIVLSEIVAKVCRVRYVAAKRQQVRLRIIDGYLARAGRRGLRRELVSEIANDAETVVNDWHETRIGVVTQGAAIVVYLGSLLSLAWQFMVIVLLANVAVLVTPMVARRLIQSRQSAVLTSMSTWTTVLSETAVGRVLLWRHGALAARRRRLAQESQDNVRTQQQLDDTHTLVAMTCALWAYAGLFVLVVVGVVLVHGGTTSVGALVAAVQINEVIAFPLTGLTGDIGILVGGRTALRRLAALETDPPAAAPPLARRDPDSSATTGHTGLATRDLMVELLDGRKLAVDDLHVATGQALVVRGQSGSGKSTMVRAFAAEHPVASGRVVAPGGDPAEAARPRAIVVESAEPLFAGTILDNVTLGRAPLTWTAGECLAFAELDVDPAASVQDRDLSTGERQRIALARALYAAPDVLLVDEAFGNLDGALRDRILRTLCDELGLAVVVVTHHQLATDWTVGEVLVDGQRADLLRPTRAGG